MNIRPAVAADFPAMWPVFQEVVAAEATYMFAADTPREVAHAYWFGSGVASFVAEDDGEVVAMYKLVPNQRDLGDHVANASFMVAAGSRGKGIGRLLGMHCLQQARQAGYLAMQFNFVISTNTTAVKLWQALGFAIVGTLPRAYRHRTLGLVDAYVMYRSLAEL